MSTPDPLLGKQLGDYKIESLIGHGGMARVYKGYDEKLDRFAAVKVIEPTLIASGEEEEYRDRFLREARSIARLNHPNIVGVYQFAQEENLYFIAMAYLDGRDLREILKEYAVENKMMPREQMLEVLHNIADGLDYAHKNGIIHRDVKPSNIIVTSEGNAVLTDFGLALNAVEGTIGNTFGSVHYIAPEQAISSAQSVAQSDQYSLGIIVYEMFAGQVPFDDASAMSVALKHISDPPPPIRDLNPKVTPELEAVVMRALDKEPRNRYPTVKEFVKTLETALDKAPEALLGDTSGERPANLPPLSPSMDDEAPTLSDTSSRPNSISSAVPPEKRKTAPESNRTMMMVIGVVVVVALLIGALLATGVLGDDIPATETAVAIAENATSTADSVFATSTAQIIATETISAENTISAATSMALELQATETASSNLTATADAEATAQELTQIANANASSTADSEATQSANETATANIENTRMAQTESAIAEVTNTQSFIETREAIASSTPTNSPTPTLTDTPRPTATFTASPTRTPTPTPSPTPTPLLVAAEGEPRLLLRYDGQSILITNRGTSGSLFINNLQFIQYAPNDAGEMEEVIRFRMSDWSSAPSLLSAGRCLQIWDGNEFSRPSIQNPLADGCTGDPFWRTSSDIFWFNSSRESYFEVAINGVDFLARCPSNRPRTTREIRCVARLG